MPWTSPSPAPKHLYDYQHVFLTWLWLWPSAPKSILTTVSSVQLYFDNRLLRAIVQVWGTSTPTPRDLTHISLFSLTRISMRNQYLYKGVQKVTKHYTFLCSQYSAVTPTVYRLEKPVCSQWHQRPRVMASRNVPSPTQEEQLMLLPLRLWRNTAMKAMEEPLLLRAITLTNSS